MIACHLGHSLDFLCALVCWIYVFPLTYPEAHQFHWNWISKIVAYNLACGYIFYGFWHWMTYKSIYSQGPFKNLKYNPENQYMEGTVNLRREITFTTLGLLQSSAFQCVVMYLWASGKVPVYLDFCKYPIWSISQLLLVTYWREFHFYWVHRMMHPWWNRKYGLKEGDVGAFLYRHFHSLHHKSYNPGPFSGLSMHPVEHFLYYTCSLLCLVFQLHPIHFLYAKFHADIAPIGGHDGYAAPGGGADFHWLHHAKFECNYGVPLVDFDKLFGTWLDYKDYKKSISSKESSPSSSKSNSSTSKPKIK